MPAIRSELCDAQYLLLPFAKLRGLMSVSVVGLDELLDGFPDSTPPHRVRRRWIHPTLQALQLDLATVMRSRSDDELRSASQQAIATQAAELCLEPRRKGHLGLQHSSSDLDDDASESTRLCEGISHEDGLARPSMPPPFMPCRWPRTGSETGQPSLVSGITDSLCKEDCVVCQHRGPMISGIRAASLCMGECLVDEHTRHMILAVRDLPNCPPEVRRRDSGRDLFI